MTSPQGVMQGGSDEWNTGATKTALALGELENQLRTLDATRLGLNTSVKNSKTSQAVDQTLTDLHTSGKNLATELDRILTNLQKRGGKVVTDDLDAAQKVLAADGSDHSLSDMNGAGGYSYAGGSGTEMSGKIDMGSWT